MLECHHRFANLLGDALATEMRERSRLLQFLDECQDAYWSVDLGGYYSSDLFQTGFLTAQKLFSLSKDAPGGLWLREFTKFAAFAMIAKALQSSKRFSKIFVSYHFEIPVSEIVRDQIKNYIRKEHGDHTTALSVENLPPGSPFRHVIRTAIWLANATIALCPADTRTISSISDKDYKWIARESEYTLILNKRVLFGIQDGADRTTILKDLSNPNIDYLVKGSKLPSDVDRAYNLKDNFDGLVQASFQTNTTNRSSDYLDARLKESVSSFIIEQNKVALEALFDGYFNQFEIEVQRATIVALGHLGYLGKQNHGWIVQRFTEGWKHGNLKNAEKAFERMWLQLRNRKLNIGSRGLSLIEMPKHHRGKEMHMFHEKLNLALRILRPEMPTKERKQWREAWLTRWGNKLRLDRTFIFG
jgi:hypothetical protein